MNTHRYLTLGLVLVVAVLFVAQINAYAAERPQVFDKDKDGLDYVKDVKLIEKDKNYQEDTDEGGRIILEIKGAIDMWLLPLGPRFYVLAVK